MRISGEPQTALRLTQVLRLKTFGGVTVCAASGEPIGGAATQRRTLALLSLLAVAGDAGLSRDKIVGLLWPDSDPERARHSLTQALYAARRALGIDDLFVAGADVRLNAERIGSDVRELEAALESGDLERAAALHQGPFLDGFYLSGSPDFDQWSTAQRDRFDDRVAAALERLAERAEEGGDTARAGEWWRRMATLRPLDSRVTLRLMSALAASGDRASALQAARVHESLLRQELGIDPDPSIGVLVEQLRATTAPRSDQPTESVDEEADIGDTAELAPIELLGQPVQALPEEPDDIVAAAPATAPAVSAPSGVAAEAHTGPVAMWEPVPRRPRWPALAALFVIVAALVGAGVMIGRGGDDEPAIEELALRQRVVVAPFRVAGASASLAYLRDGMVELLSTRLADDTAARSVDAGAVLGAWRTAGLSARPDVPRDTVVRIAGRLGAERVVVGSVVGTPSNAVVTATVLVVSTGEVSGEATVSGATDSITVLVDRLAARLLVSEAGEDESLAGYTTSSLPALRAYLSGQAALRRNDYTAAARDYDLALRRDSTFALAALQLSVAAQRLGDHDQMRRALDLAWRSRSSLTDRDAALLVAATGPRYPAPSPSSEQAAAWQRVVDLAPGSAEAWLELGTRLFHDGAAAGLTDARARATAALERAVGIGPAMVDANHLLVQLDGRARTTGDSAAVPDPFSPFVRWRAAAAAGDTAVLRHIRDTMLRLGPANLRAIAMASLHDAVLPQDGAVALEILRARASRPADRAAIAAAEHALATSRGRERDAALALGQLARAQPGGHAALRLRVLDALYGGGDTTAASVAARQLAAATGDDPSAAAASSSDAWFADACVVAQWRVARGDTAGVLRTSAQLRGHGATHPALPAAASPAACAELLDASVAVATRGRDARGAVRRLDSLAFTLQTAGDAAAYAPLLTARLHDRLGDTEQALRAVRRRVYMSGWPRYRAAELREEGRLAELAGDLEGARLAYTRYLALRDAPDGAASEEVAAVRQRLTELTAPQAVR